MSNDTSLVRMFAEEVDRELKSANEKFPPFHSNHEGYAVLLEEWEELKADLDYCQTFMDALWAATKNNDEHEVLVNLVRFRGMMIQVHIESVQVAAMLGKWSALWDEKEAKDE